VGGKILFTQTSVKNERAGKNALIKELPTKKMCEPLMLGESLDR